MRGRIVFCYPASCAIPVPARLGRENGNPAFRQCTSSDDVHICVSCPVESNSFLYGTCPVAPPTADFTGSFRSFLCVIPAQAGIQHFVLLFPPIRSQCTSSDDVHTRIVIIAPLFVIPAQAGIQHFVNVTSCDDVTFYFRHK